jgi:hypothetical protein
MLLLSRLLSITLARTGRVGVGGQTSLAIASLTILSGRLAAGARSPAARGTLGSLAGAAGQPLPGLAGWLPAAC